MQMTDKKQLCKLEPLGMQLTQLSKLYYGVVANKLNDIDIDRYYYSMILIKEGDGKITQKELSEKICLDKVFVVKILDYLSAKDMVRRQVNEKDRRAHFIKLTEKGEKVIPEIVKVYNETNASALKGLSIEEQEIYFNVLGKIKKNLQSMPADEVKINYSRIEK